MNKTVKNIIDSVWGALTQRPCYKHSMPDTVTGDEFAVVNTLGMPIDPIQTVEVNVNVYVKDINPQQGIPNLTRLDALTASAIAQVSGYHGTGDNIIHISLQASILLREPELQMHLMNNRFQAIYLNN
jgi:hypothetical protein